MGKAWSQGIEVESWIHLIIELNQMHEIMVKEQNVTTVNP